ncbi:hypothetical protein GCM10022225_23760 [Plantactinospora mayteni]|uniref:Calcineurin-like phosphoesterase domain-containing protein n=1 Tax=Plantactinospora mayteni TaxID=566021 RepID=A0ABQ4EJW2_9ACTN|nr:hypothetical protein Pma05_14680 [Plantactinospora mayteni]
MPTKEDVGPGENHGRRVDRVVPSAARFADCDLLVFGHSHLPWHSEAPGGLRLLNPGSPTERK